MKLREHINLYHGGNVSRFAKSFGEPRGNVNYWLSSDYEIDNFRVFKTVKKITQSELDHVKKVKGQ